VRQLVTAALEDRDGPLWIVILAGALRLGETLALRWSDWEEDRGRLLIRRALQQVPGHREFKEPKTHGSRRAVPIGRLGAEALARPQAVQAADRLKAGERW